MIVSPEKRSAIEANLFPGSLPAIADWTQFPWHLHGNQIDSDVPHSSQALALSVFGFVKCAPSAERDIAMNTLATLVGVPTGNGWRIELEWTDHGNPLKERQRTQLDVFAKHAAGMICVECKFGEGDGGPCSQPAVIRSGAHAGERQCNDSYAMQINPVNGREARCALTGKGIRYWQHATEVFTISADIDHRPCPFRYGWYQWMRNLTLCHALAEAVPCRGGVLVVYADAPGLPFAEKVRDAEWTRLRALVRRDRIGFEAVSYQSFLDESVTRIRDAGFNAATWAQLAEWTETRIGTVATAKRSRGARLRATNSL
jgi:hypothetical protein